MALTGKTLKQHGDASKKKQKKKGFTKKERDEIFHFIRNHTFNILNCGRIDYQLEGVGHTESDGKTLMWINIDTQYMQFTLHYVDENILPRWRDKKYEYLLGVLCHEISHIVVEEFIYNIQYKSKKQLHYWLERHTEKVARWLEIIYMEYMKQEKVNLKTGR